MIDPAHARGLTEAAAGGVSERGPSRLCRDSVWAEAVGLMNGARRVAVVTGFFIPAAGAPETDGPPGAVVLARALSRRGADAYVWTDHLCVGAVAGCAGAIGFPAARVTDVSGDLERGDVPDLLIYVERLGRARDGAYYDMRGRDVSEFAPPLDAFALRGTSRVIGVGDGGNEVGMGNYFAELSEMMPGYARCLSRVGADAAVPVDVSNWGAYALAAALSCEAGEWLGQTESEERAMMEAMTDLGAVDGVRKTASGSVDGFDLSRQLEVVAELRNLL
jgi:hypothetical protein